MSDTHSIFATRLREHATTQAARRPPLRLAHAREWFPRPMAIMDSVVREAQRLYPHVGIGMSATTREGNPEALFLRIGVANARKKRLAKCHIEVSVFPDEMFWDVDDVDAQFLRGEDNPDAEEAFGSWLVAEIAKLLDGLYPIGIGDHLETPVSD